MEDWISVIDSHPEYGQGVLVHLSDGLITCGYFFNKSKTNSCRGWQIFGDILMDETKINGSVTHWMPLPQPPKQTPK